MGLDIQWLVSLALGRALLFDPGGFLWAVDQAQLLGNSGLLTNPGGGLGFFPDGLAS